MLNFNSLAETSVLEWLCNKLNDADGSSSSSSDVGGSNSNSSRSSSRSSLLFIKMFSISPK